MKRLYVGLNPYLSAKKRRKKLVTKLKEKCASEHCKVTFVHMIVTGVRGTHCGKCRYER